MFKWYKCVIERASSLSSTSVAHALSFSLFCPPSPLRSLFTELILPQLFNEPQLLMAFYLVAPLMGSLHMERPTRSIDVSHIEAMAPVVIAISMRSQTIFAGEFATRRAILEICCCCWWVWCMVIGLCGVGTIETRIINLVGGRQSLCPCLSLSTSLWMHLMHHWMWTGWEGRVSYICHRIFCNDCNSIGFVFMENSRIDVYGA